MRFLVVFLALLFLIPAQTQAEEKNYTLMAEEYLMIADMNLDGEKLTCFQGIFKILKIKVRRIPRGKTLSEVD